MISISLRGAASSRGRVPAALLCIAAGLPLVATDALAEWKPNRSVEFIAINAPGGGSDRILRLMLKVIKEKRYVETSVNVVNKPGGGGAIAYTYLNSHPADGHFILMANKSLLTNNLVGRGPSYTQFTPIVKLFDEYISVTVRPDSPIKTAKDLIKRLQQDPQALTFGIATSLGNLNHQGVAVALKEAGVDIKETKNVIFQSGGKAVTALLGGHVDVVPITAAFAASRLRNGQLRVIAVTAPMRLAGVLAEVPTWREQGYDNTVSNWRGFVGPKGMTDAQAAYWEQFMKRLASSDEWKKELDTNFWSSDLKGQIEYRQQIKRDNVQLHEFLSELGLAK